MTGWRLGYGVMPVALAEHVTRLMVNSNSCTASFTQMAGIAALQGDQTPVHRDGGRVQAAPRRAGGGAQPAARRLLPLAARRLLRVPEHQGAQAALDRGGGDLLREAGVAVLGGSAFGEYGEGYLRLSYASAEANLRKALERMEPVLARLAGA